MSKFVKNKLPSNWIWTTLGDIGIVVSGGTPSTRNKEFWGGDIPWITPADLSGYNNKFISRGKRDITQVGLDYSSAKLLPAGSICFSSRAPIGYTVIAKNELATNQGFKNLVPTKSLNSEYVFYYFKTLKSKAEKVASGTTFLELSATKFSQLFFPLPPLKEQARIVSKIEILFSELDHAEKGLLKAQKQLKVYKQSLLQKTFNGELISENWNYSSIKDVSEFIGSGSTPKGGRSVYSNEGIPFIRSQNVLVNKFVQYDLVFISATIHKKMKRTHTKPKDVLLNITGASIGRSAYIPEGFLEGNVNQHVCIIRLNHSLVNYKYLTFFLNSPETQIVINQINSGATREALTLSQIKDFKIPLCNIQEQTVIVQNLESNFSLINNLENTINKSLKDILTSRYSLLKQAFEGRLLEQDLNDIHASELLKKIKLEKGIYIAEQEKLKKSKPKKIKKMSKSLSIEQVLKTSDKPILAKTVWQESKHNGNIEEFYAELKELGDKVIEIKEGLNSSLSLRK